jgi:DNA-binding LacI/PurR family transcriptional regulator
MSKETGVTLDDIARSLNYSVSVVSRALNPDNRSGPIDPEKKRRVLEEARVLGYMPPKRKGRRTRSIGVVVPQLYHAFYTAALESIAEHAGNRGYRVVIASAQGEDKQNKYGSTPADAMSRVRALERGRIHALLKGHVDGVLAIPSCDEKNHDLWREVLNQDIPLVFIDEDLTQVIQGADAVQINNTQGGRDATWHLFKNGHTRIGFLSGPAYLPSYKAREDGYREAFTDVKAAYEKAKPAKPNAPELDRSLVRHFPLFEFDCMKEVHYLLDQVKRKSEQADRVTAIIANDEWIGQCLLNAAVEQHIDIPNQLSVITVGNVIGMSALTLPFTSIVHSPEILAELAVERLFRRIRDGKTAADDLPARTPMTVAEAGGHLKVGFSVYDRDYLSNDLPPEWQ